MGLTKQYLRYAAYGIFNLIGGRSNLVFLTNEKTKKKLCAVGACENVILWDLRKGEKVATLYGDQHHVTTISKSPTTQHLAVGYQDGSIKVFDLRTADITVTYNGHKKAVTALNYDHDGLRLVSGAVDTEVIVWDIVNESGLYRLKGHKGPITQARFVNNKNMLITSSKDTFVKFWDLDTQHCFKTLVTHRTEVWDFVLTQNGTRLITGSADTELRVWSLQNPSPADDVVPAKRQKTSDISEMDPEEPFSDEEAEDDGGILSCVKLGSLKRQGNGRVTSMMVDPTGQYFGCHGSDYHLELYRINSENEAVKHLNKRQKKARKRLRESGSDVNSVSALTSSTQDQYKRLGAIKMSAKIRSFDILSEQENSVQVLGLLNNNTIESYTADCSEKNLDTNSASKLVIPGHRTDVRAMCFSSDNTAIMSASAEAVKVWNRATLQCIRTMPCDYALCCVFAPGDRHVVTGSKSGKLQIFDIAAGVLLESIDAHAQSVWSMCLSSDKKGIVTGSADKSVKFWDFELVTDTEPSSTTARLTLVHTRTLQMSEDVLCVKLSPDNRLLAVSLLDNTVKVFFVDTLKFFLSLYGHKMPVLCMDISADGTLLVTGSADRNCKVWGLDFGDCHKSIFAHDDSIMCVSFVSKTHMFFTGGKDKLVKEWDADSFQHIQTLKGHHAEVWSLAVSPNGTFLATASHDKSVRVWERTDEALIVDEEREMERERQAEEEGMDRAPHVIAGETNKETGMAGKQTIETVKAAERIMEALELYADEQAKLSQHQHQCSVAGKQLKAPPLHSMFQAFHVQTPDRYMLEVIKKVKSSELEESLLVLPFSYVTQLLPILNTFIDAGWAVELSCRCSNFLLRIHQGQITSNQVLLPVVDQLRKSTTNKVNQERDTIGRVLSGLKMLKQKMDERESVQLLPDATSPRVKPKHKKPKTRTILTIKTV